MIGSVALMQVEHDWSTGMRRIHGMRIQNKFITTSCGDIADSSERQYMYTLFSFVYRINRGRIRQSQINDWIIRIMQWISRKVILSSIYCIYRCFVTINTRVEPQHLGGRVGFLISKRWHNCRIMIPKKL